VICELINVDVKLNGYGKTSRHCWFCTYEESKYFKHWKYYTRISYLPEVMCQDWILIKDTINVRKTDRLSLVICKMSNRILYSVFSFLLTLHSPHTTVSQCSMFLLFKSHWRPVDTHTVFTELQSVWRCVETGFPLESINSPLSPNTILTT
jgi:hypothetical protein